MIPKRCVATLYFNYVLFTIFSYALSQNFNDGNNNADVTKPSISDSITENISFQCYLNTINDYITISYADSFSKLSTACINNTQKTIIFYFPGWTNQPSKQDDRIDDIINAYLKRGKILPIVVNYENLLKGPNVSMITVQTIGPSLQEYNLAAANSKLIGKNVGKVIVELYTTYQLPIENLHLVGLSLGAQIESFVAKYFIEKTDQKLPRITGLDPAGVPFYPPSVHLEPSDADFVDVIHTNPGMLGFGLICGHADFYVNYPSPFQPGCPSFTGIIQGNVQSLFCSHEISGMYYAESVNNPKNFPACNNLWSFLQEECSGENTSFMGYDVPTTARGKYILGVNPNPPYGLGARLN